MQRSILNQYMYLKKNPTLREIACDTGIHLSRIFRIRNGCRMKLDEYEIFRMKILEQQEARTLVALADSCLVHLKPSAVREIETLMERKLKLRRLMQEVS